MLSLLVSFVTNDIIFCILEKVLFPLGQLLKVVILNGRSCKMHRCLSNFSLLNVANNVALMQLFCELLYWLRCNLVKVEYNFKFISLQNCLLGISCLSTCDSTLKSAVASVLVVAFTVVMTLWKLPMTVLIVMSI